MLEPSGRTLRTRSTWPRQTYEVSRHGPSEGHNSAMSIEGEGIGGERGEISPRVVRVVPDL